MHEMALAESVLELVELGLREAPGAQVRVVRLDIGELSHADPDALSFCFGAVARGTAADGARLEITRAPGRCWCHDCNAEVPLPALGSACPACGGYALRVTGGEQLRVREIEVE